MHDLALRVSNLGKQYRIGGEQAAYRTLREGLTNSLAAPFRRTRDLLRGQAYGAADLTEEIWALRDVSFEVKQGETVGIIGRNGAGKSTLLKILSRITEPTEGRVMIRGQVGSLLEVGTGFHPELTGRENIYLNAAILGMKRTEINRKFDEIVDFSGVEKFIDTPVKHYSSGMLLRLGFAVSAYLEPDILVVDEILAVGDLAFQKKSMGKMTDIAQQGRTVLFVSHNMGAVAALTQRCVWIDAGRLTQEGPSAEVLAAYQASLYPQAQQETHRVLELADMEHYGTGRARIQSIRVMPMREDDSLLAVLLTGQDLKIDLQIKAYDAILEANVAIIIYDLLGYRLIDSNIALQGGALSLERDQLALVTLRLKNVLLKPGAYLLGLWIGRTNVEDIDGITYAVRFHVEPDPEKVAHTQIFPGVYQCEFTYGMQVNNQAAL